MSSYKSPYQINLSKQSRKQARDVKRSSNSININSIGSNNNSSSIVPIGKRAKAVVVIEKLNQEKLEITIVEKRCPFQLQLQS